MGLVAGPPTLAVEVRSKTDDGASAEAAMAAKRADYFQAGNLAVWDVDPRNECVRSYSIGAPDRAAFFSKGHVADAGPAVKGWQMAVEDIFA